MPSISPSCKIDELWCDLAKRNQHSCFVFLFSGKSDPGSLCWLGLWISGLQNSQDGKCGISDKKKFVDLEEGRKPAPSRGMLHMRQLRCQPAEVLVVIG